MQIDLLETITATFAHIIVLHFNMSELDEPLNYLKVLALFCIPAPITSGLLKSSA